MAAAALQGSPPQLQAEIGLGHLTKRFGDVLAVDDISLEIRAGEFFSLLGPSGCGKTTTLRMIGGFDLPTSGRIELRGRDVTRDPPDKRPVNMVFQSYALFPHLDVAGNIAFGLKRRGIEGGEIKRRTADILEKVRLPGYEKRRTHELSGGQQQRIALARALVNEPNVLLLDEPLGALDLKLRKNLQLELKRIQKDVGITFVYVTHDQEEALTMSDRIAVMSGGRIEQVGSPEDLYDRPRTPFVADFIGTTNLLSGRVIEVRGEEALVRLESGDVCRAGADGCSPGTSVQLSVRPESIELRRGEDAARGPSPGSIVAPAADGSIRAAIEQVAYLGSAVQYHVRTAGGMAVTALAPRSGPRFEPGDTVVLAWSPTDALLLGDRPAELEESA
jgi:spermidine/putrescine transport system ATP-binding protein